MIVAKIPYISIHKPKVKKANIREKNAIISKMRENRRLEAT